MSYPIIPPVDSVTHLFPASTMQALAVVFQDMIASQIPPASALALQVVGDGTAAVPPRPSTTGRVGFFTAGVVSAGGTTAGGTAKMIAGYDLVINPNGGGGGGSGGSVSVIVESPLGSGNYGNRPAGTTMQLWAGVTPPAGGGTTAGGNPQMVDGLDEWDYWVQG